MYPQFISEDKDREMVLSLDIALLERCDQIWVFREEGEDLTEGMKLEIAMARLNNIYVRMVEPDLFESFRKNGEKVIQSPVTRAWDLIEDFGECNVFYRDLRDRGLPSACKE